MVNYVLSFCKITGASKIFTRNFYLPLLKPLTPRDALRTLRITGKWLLGAKYQHYIPVLRNHRQKRSKKSKNYGTKEHKKMDDYTYMTPTFDPENENQKRLQKILDSKQGEGGMYVYTVEDKKYNIVVQAAFELAVRDGDIIDVLVSQKNDKILVKTKDMKKVPLEIQYYEQNRENLFCGEGATNADEEKFHHHGKYTMGLAKLFEDKEMQEEKWEEELKKIMKKRKKQKWEGTKAFKEMMKQIMRKFDWKKFEEDAKKVIDDIEAPVTERPIPMEIADLSSTRHVNETLSQREDLLNQLPNLKDIPDIIKSLGSATLTEIENDDRKVTGAKVVLPSGKECFISGQMVHTEEGDVFVPGQTVQNEFGDEYAPGITINIDNKPTLVNGLIMGDEEKDPLFLPTQSTITSGGQLTFATAPEERPNPEPEEQRQKRRRKLLRIISVVPEEESNEEECLKEVIEDIMKESGLQDFENIEIIVDKNRGLMDEDEESDDISTDDTASSADELIEELDIEAIRLKHEKQQKELEKLKMILQDDGMNDLIDSLEQKKLLLKQKLEELRKLSLLSENNLVTYINDTDAYEAASKITQEKESINRLAEILIAITRRSAAFRDRNSIRLENINLDVNIKPTEVDLKFNKSSTKLKILFKTALVAANDVYKNRPKDQVLALHSVVEIIEESLQRNPQLLHELLKLLETSVDRLEVCDAVLKQLIQDISHTKVATLKKLSCDDLALPECLKHLDRIIEDGTVMNVSFTKLAKLCPEIVKDLSDNVKLRCSKGASSEEAALEVLQDSIVATVRALMNSNFEELLGKKESTMIEFIEEALSFARALDLEEVVDNLSQPKTSLNNLSDASIEMLKRMTVIRQLAEKDYSLKTAISRIKKNHECAKSDPRIRQLMRESAIVISEMSPIRTSRDMPYELMKKQNLLAIEDFLMRRMRLDVPVLITRGSMQAVIPKESARGVLAGRIPYILIDESGVTNFKPMHMLSSINVNKNRERRIEDYLSGVRERSKSIDLDRKDFSDSRTYFQAKNNVRKLRRMLNRKAA